MIYASCAASRRTVVYSAEGAAGLLRATEATCQYGTESVRRADNSVYQGQVANGG
ncbi:MAG: hypothetical protein IPL19_08920 [Sandaracinaceae bacterium]|nr:hypothetical protein [Sandaracinaceae bacterium]